MTDSSPPTKADKDRDSTTTTTSLLADNFAKATTLQQADGGGDDHVVVTAAGTVDGPSSSSSLMKPHTKSIPRTVTRNNVKSIHSNGIIPPTNATVQIFSNRIVMLVSQLPSSKVGTFLMCEYQPCQINPKTSEYLVTNLMGCGSSSDEALLDIYARNILQGIVNIHKKNQEIQFPTVLVLGISLLKKKPNDGNGQQQQHEAFKSLVNFLVNELYCNAISL